MKKKLLIIILFAIMFLPIINVSAECYKKCDNGADCTYVKTCLASDRITCEGVSDLYCPDATPKVSCGNITEIPEKIPEITSFIITMIQIAVPVVLVIMGTLDLFKGITAGKEDEIKKGQQLFIKRLIVAAIMFFVIVIVKFVISIVADSTSSQNMTECIDCFLSGVENCRR